MRNLHVAIQRAMTPLPQDIQRAIMAHVIALIQWFTKVKGDILYVSANDIVSYFSGTFAETDEYLKLFPGLRICIQASIYGTLRDEGYDYPTVIDGTTLKHWLTEIPASKVVLVYDAIWWNK